ncbi:MAG: UbiD family decarboxylase [Chloroflexi bacterium]|nr:UbiD family decarboxylase [Chloroflexota bacterium]
MPYKDLRDFLSAAEARGELRHIKGADRDLEMSSITEILYRESKQPWPAILFDEVPGYPKGFRTLFGHMASPWKLAKTLGLPEDQLDNMSLLHSWRSKAKDLRLIPPKTVSSGPIRENLMTGDQIDLFKFPSPRFHEMDTTNPYIGTAVAVIQRDPDGGWVNSGAYRVMVVDRNRLTFHATEGKHGSLITRKYHNRGRVMPIVVALGVDPAFYAATSIQIGWGISEYDYAGGIKGEPLEVIEGPYTGLSLPASAEIVIEGECHPEEEADEGPFGEWHGYYANLGLQTVPEPVIRVKAIHYRNDPILACAHETVPPHDDTLFDAITVSARLWGLLEGAGLPGIKGVWSHEVGHGLLFDVVSIEQLYSGHSREVALTVLGGAGGHARYVIIVEEDIDPSNLEQVIWAMLTRAMPSRDTINIVERCRGTNSDPAIPLETKRKYLVPPKPLYSSRVIIDTCRGLEHKADWYPIARVSPELRAKILSKWGAELPGIVK